MLWETTSFLARGPVVADAMGCGPLEAQESRIFHVLTAGPTLRLAGNRLGVFLGEDEVMVLSRMQEGQGR